MSKAANKSIERTLGEFDIDAFDKAEQKKLNKFFWFGLTICLVAAVLGSTQILVLSGFTRWTWPMPLLTGEPHGLTAAVTWFGGVIGLGTFFLNRHQKDFLARRVQKQTEAHEINRDKREYTLAASKRLDEQFLEISRDFTSSDKSRNIHAAIAFTELALTPDPRKIDGQGLFIRTSSEVFDTCATNRSVKTAHNYPFFERAAERLASALHQWRDDASSKQVIAAIQKLAVFSSDPETDEPLLHLLTNLVAEANRTALLAFNRPFVCAWAFYEQGTLSDYIPFRSIESNVKDALSDYYAWADSFLRIEKDLNEWRRNFQTDLNPRTDVDETILQFASDSRILWNTQVALADCMNRLSGPFELADWSRQNETEQQTSLEKLAARRRLDFSGTFLISMELKNAKLQGSNFSNSFLGATKFYSCDMRGCKFDNARLASTKFTSDYDPRNCFSDMRFSSFKEIALSGNFSYCDVRHSDFSKAFGAGDFRFANADYCHLPNRKLFIGDNCEGISLENCTYESEEN